MRERERKKAGRKEKEKKRKGRDIYSVYRGDWRVYRRTLYSREREKSCAINREDGLPASLLHVNLPFFYLFYFIL